MKLFLAHTSCSKEKYMQENVIIKLHTRSIRTHQCSENLKSITSHETKKPDYLPLHLGKYRKEYALVQKIVPNMIAIHKTS